MSSSLSEEGDIFDQHRFRSLYNQRLFEEIVSRKEIIPEKGFDCDEDYPEIKKHIYKRGWRRLVSPREVSKNLVREFYANANRSKEEMEELQVQPYTSRVRGVEIDFSPANLARVMRFKEETPGAENSFENRQNGNQQLDAVIKDLCIQGATWKMGTGRDPKPIQLRRQELCPLARGDDVRAEDIIADNMVIIAQSIRGKGLLGFPCTIYKLCKDAGVRMREFKRTEHVPEERYITAKVMEATRIPRMIQQNPHHEEEEEDQAMPQVGVENEEVEKQEQEQEQPYVHQEGFNAGFQQTHLEQQQPQYVTYADFQQFQQRQMEQMQQYQQNQLELQQHGFQKLNEKIANMQIGIQTAQGKYTEEVQRLQRKQQDVYNYMKEKHKFVAKELDEIKRFQVGQTLMASSQTDPIEKVNMTLQEHCNEMIMIKRQLKEWTRNASHKDAYCCWAH
ncbi:hypothetical protein PIB30_070929 [Stylosanthes scabra]|uniref:Putative plant transposon protein domain-containing protein n=1 Tax=Stylosanthes scabra TaxID=79078 RepID=A0ABU6QPN7_9FABA|nr:hypothetical protein [Stylosanthes scabra]